MKLLALILLAVAALDGQTVPVDIIVNFPPDALVKAKYGPLPKWAHFGEVIGCNRGTHGLTYGEGDIIAAIRTSNVGGGYQVFSRLDAIQLVSNSQAASTKNLLAGWVKAIAQTAVEAKAGGLIGGGNATGVGIVAGASLIGILLPNIQGVLNLRQLQQYVVDGIQTTMTVPAGRCTLPLSVLFADPGVTPKNSPPPIALTINAPVDR